MYLRYLHEYGRPPVVQLRQRFTVAPQLLSGDNELTGPVGAAELEPPNLKELLRSLAKYLADPSTRDQETYLAQLKIDQSGIVFLTLEILVLDAILTDAGQDLWQCTVLQKIMLHIFLEQLVPLLAPVSRLHRTHLNTADSVAPFEPHFPTPLAAPLPLGFFTDEDLGDQPHQLLALFKVLDISTQALGLCPPLDLAIEDGQLEVGEIYEAAEVNTNVGPVVSFLTDTGEPAQEPQRSQIQTLFTQALAGAFVFDLAELVEKLAEAMPE